MCGIAGLLRTGNERLDSIFKMTDVQRHRGPDGFGHIFIDVHSSRFTRDPDKISGLGPCLALGHRRLAILDCTDAGLQPMSGDEGRYWITYNGEVYNYRDLRDELIKLGHAFTSGTDTEVVLAAYREWGTSCFERFNGMWGMAIWDGIRRQLVLSRDRLGVKPLHYAFSDAGLVFASEIKAVLASGFISNGLQAKVAADYLKWGMVNHLEDTFLSEVKAFPPGCFAVVESDRPTWISPVSYWQLETKAESVYSMDAAAHHFKEIFVSAVSLRMRSDVPVGACLSGGLDSSAIVSVAAGLPEAAGRFATFTSAAEDPRFDESAWADLVNKKVGADAHFVTPSEDSFLDELSDLLWHQEEPFTTASIYAQWCVMRKARESGVPVLLDGQGADEVLCGYRKFYLFYLKQMISRGEWAGVLSEIMGMLFYGDRGLLRWREGRRYLPGRFGSGGSGLSELLNPEFRQLWERSNLGLGAGKDVRQRQVDDITKFSVPSLLRYEDRNSMAWSIESRVPFLDYRLVEFLISLPAGIKMKNGRTKAVLRRALRGTVPQQILDRRDKMGFVTAQELWMKNTLGRKISEFLSDPTTKIARLLDGKGIPRNLQGSGSDAGQLRISNDELFRIFVLGIWMERFNVEI